MAALSISEALISILNWSSTPANNTTIGSIDIGEGCSPGNLNNAIRELMAQTRDFFEDGTCSIAMVDALGNVATMGGGNAFRFWRTGNLVHVSGSLNWTATTALQASSRIKLTGLPYALRNVNGYRSVAEIGPAAAGSLLIEREKLTFYADANSDFLWGTKVTTGNTAGNLTKTDIGTSGTIYGLSLTYLCDYYN